MNPMIPRTSAGWSRVLWIGFVLCRASVGWAASEPTFEKDIRPILKAHCFDCHGEGEQLKGGLDVRLRRFLVAGGDDGPVIVPGNPEESVLLKLVESGGMPKRDKKLTSAEVALIRDWIATGAKTARAEPTELPGGTGGITEEERSFWSFQPITRPKVPRTRARDRARTPVDAFLVEAMRGKRLGFSADADRVTLLRRVSFDLTGLPPTPEATEAFLEDRSPDAYERLVDRMLDSKHYGERWGRHWLDVAGYADSDGYSDADPPRPYAYKYRDYVIRSINSNKPFDRFTLEQLAGDLLPDAGDEELVATAFHRNTQTNNEGGTSDEEYRNVAVVDRVNTTMAVWMGTTMACAQCHNHKYDPISQEDYFRLFAVFNNTADADRTDESPVHALYTPEQKLNLKQWNTGIARLESILKTSTPELEADQAAWEAGFTKDLYWNPLALGAVTSKAGATVQAVGDGSVRVARGGATDTYTVEVPMSFPQTLTAVRLEVLPEVGPPARGVGHADGNFVVTRVTAKVAPPTESIPRGRYVRIEIPGKDKILSLA